MCGKDGIFHGKFLKPKFSLPFSNYGDKKKPKAKPLTPEEEVAQAEAQAAQDANTQVATTRRRRLRASLFAGGRSVLGSPSGRGAPAGAGGGSSSGASGGSVTGSGARSYGGDGGSWGGQYRPNMN